MRRLVRHLEEHGLARASIVLSGRVSRLKTRNSRRDLPISPAVARKLWAMRPPHADGPIFVTRNGTRFNDRNVRRVLDAAAERTGEYGGRSARH